MADSKEAQFQQDIIDALAAQGWGWISSRGNSHRMADFSHEV